MVADHPSEVPEQLYAVDRHRPVESVAARTSHPSRHAYHHRLFLTFGCPWRVLEEEVRLSLSQLSP